MDKKTLAALKKLYRYDNSGYDAERGVSLYRLESLSLEERRLLTQYGWEANELEWITHDEGNRKLMALQSDERLSWSGITGAFIAGVGGSFPRGISPLMSYHRMLQMKEHEYVQAKHFICCKTCGFHKDQWENVSYIRYTLHLGNVYGSSTTGAYADLTEIAELLEHSPIVPAAADIELFRQLIKSLDSAPSDETPGQFEKRLTSSRLIKGTAGTRRGILQSLAVLGVLPNQILTLTPGHWTNTEEMLNGELHLNNTRGRSDMEMPWAGWQGKLGVNTAVLDQLFGEFL
ncbi:hypothetical protein PAECIP111892_01383 [Paenibacillus auburnensis]|uniref:Uncharacterized protein n=1 Tax=Paenibacillus auburnensis TaxID=2905649 RepID=A0ABM9BSU1_9BACL|nr:hypothetical protein [Paenibacillus auburnensis]CAH1194018.1 hypothetical protein PAECIP111892_01383 [Paenibacillus auburnensis]